MKIRYLFFAGLIFTFILVWGDTLKAREKINREIDALVEGLSRTISMDYRDADLKVVLKALSIQAGLNFIASQEIEDRRVTLYLDNVPVREAINKLLYANQLDYEFFESANIFVVKPAAPEVKTITRVFPLKHARVESSRIEGEITEYLGTSRGEEIGIKYAIKNLLSDQGSFVEDVRTNSFIITDNPARIRMIESAIKEIDVSVPQLMLEVEILDVQKATLDKLGFQHSESPLTLARGQKFFMGDLTKKGLDIGSPGVAGAVIAGNNYAALLNLLRQHSDTRSLARPRILTLNNEPAEIAILADAVIGTKRTRESYTEDEVSKFEFTFEAEREEVGISLRVVPQIHMESGEITMFLYPKVAEARMSTVQPAILPAGQTPFQDIEERRTKSVVKVRDGETIVLGGLIYQSREETFSKVPMFGDLPILGAAFRHRKKDVQERELLVFITPHIIKDTPALVRADYLGILPLREQDMP